MAPAPGTTPVPMLCTCTCIWYMLHAFLLFIDACTGGSSGFIWGEGGVPSPETEPHNARLLRTYPDVVGCSTCIHIQVYCIKECRAGSAKSAFLRFYYTRLHMLYSTCMYMYICPCTFTLVQLYNHVPACVNCLYMLDLNIYISSTYTVCSQCSQPFYILEMLPSKRWTHIHPTWGSYFSLLWK